MVGTADPGNREEGSVLWGGTESMLLFWPMTEL